MHCQKIFHVCMFDGMPISALTEAFAEKHLRVGREGYPDGRVSDAETGH
jgi:hypothetical protein